MKRKTRYRIYISIGQIALIAVFLLLWQYLPTVGDLASRTHYLDPFFISSPSRIAGRLQELFVTGQQQGGERLWPFLWPTLGATLLGGLIGVVLGVVFGLLFSNFKVLRDLLMPFIAALNAIPRIALIPVIVLFVGIRFKTDLVSSVLVVFFVVFYNAYEGGRTVPLHLLQNAKLLGASNWDSMRSVRLPYVLAWTTASLPLAFTFSLLAVVTCEILTGYKGIGQLLGTATSMADATLTFAVVAVLSFIGLATVGILEVVKRRVLHWW